MSESLYPYYKRELLFIRQMAQEFAREYPAAAGRLLIEQDRSADPHVERLIESFALIAGRVQHKLDDEFPELTDALLGILYPHYLAPVPSTAIVQFVLDPARSNCPRASASTGAQLAHRSGRRPGLPLSHRLSGDALAGRTRTRRLPAPPFPPGLAPPPRTVAALRLQLECQGQLDFADLAWIACAFFLYGDNQQVHHALRNAASITPCRWCSDRRTASKVGNPSAPAGEA